MDRPKQRTTECYPVRQCFRIEQNLVIFDPCEIEGFRIDAMLDFPSDLVQLGDVVLNISRRIPISLFKLVLLGIQVFFAIRNRYIFTSSKHCRYRTPLTGVAKKARIKKAGRPPVWR